MFFYRKKVYIYTLLLYKTCFKIQPFNFFYKIYYNVNNIIKYFNIFTNAILEHVKNIPLHPYTLKPQKLLRKIHKTKEQSIVYKLI